jgi:hypothetical protein
VRAALVSGPSRGSGLSGLRVGSEKTRGRVMQNAKKVQHTTTVVGEIDGFSVT